MSALAAVDSAAPAASGRAGSGTGVWNLCLKAEKHEAVCWGSYRLASRTMQTQFKSRLTTPLKEGGIKPQKTGMKEVQTKACEDNRE